MRPPIMVISTDRSLILSASTEVGSSEITVRSASFPGSIEPLMSSSKVAYAPPSVYALMASSAFTLCSGPSSMPASVFLVAARARRSHLVLRLRYRDQIRARCLHPQKREHSLLSGHVISFFYFHRARELCSLKGLSMSYSQTVFWEWCSLIRVLPASVSSTSITPLHPQRAHPIVFLSIGIDL